MVDISGDHNQSQQNNDEINRFRVLIRVRPFLGDEMNGAKKLRTQCIQFYSDNQTLSLIRPNYDQRDFYFDSVLDHEAEQETAYEQIAQPVVQDVLNGFNGVVMAYGQTGSGKTHTIFGSRASLDHLYSKKPQDEGLHYECGIVPRCVNHIFDYIKDNPNNGQFRITVSFLEIYMEQITDLLLQQTPAQQSTSPNPRASSHSPLRQSTQSLNNQASGQNLKLREDPKTGIFVDGLTQVNVKTKEILHQLIKMGAKRRSVNQTAMNKNSSRSHAVLQIFVEQRWTETQIDNAKPENGGSPNTQHNRTNSSGQQQIKKRHLRKALLTIVDLAGSERLSKTGSEGMRLQEAKNINKSIAALSNCISALASEKSLNHVPFRDSKLTRLLTESLGGNSKTTICACIGPSLDNYEESYSTLLFATRAMSVRTCVKMNEKIEYKMIDEQGRYTTSKNTPNEKMLFKKNSELQEQTEQLQQELLTLREQIKKQQSIVSTFTNVSNNANGPVAYNSNNTHNTSMDAANAAQGSNNWNPKQNGTSRNQYLNNNHSQQMPPRSQSPQPPSNQFNPLTIHQFTGNNGYMFGTQIYNPSPQKGQALYGGLITPQDSQNFQFEGQNSIPSATNNSYTNIHIKQSQQLYQQQQKDSQLIQKLSVVIDNLQDEVMLKTVQVSQLQEENQRLKQMNGGNNGQQPNLQSTIDSILANPNLRQVLFEKLARSSYQQ